jgi:hypothetical protein
VIVPQLRARAKLRRVGLSFRSKLLFQRMIPENATTFGDPVSNAFSSPLAVPKFQG